MYNKLLFSFFFLLGLSNALHSQSPHFLIRTNVLVLPQPNFALEVEFQPVYNIGIIAGVSSRDGLSNLGNLAWFRNGYSKCKVETYSLLTGLAYLHPLNSRWEVGGKLLYQYVRTYVFEETCIADYPNHPAAPDLYTINSHSVNLLPAVRYFPGKHLFLEGVFGLGMFRGELNTGDYDRWFAQFPGQLNVGLRF